MATRHSRHKVWLAPRPHLGISVHEDAQPSNPALCPMHVRECAGDAGGRRESAPAPTENRNVTTPLVRVPTAQRDRGHDRRAPGPGPQPEAEPGTPTDGRRFHWQSFSMVSGAPTALGPNNHADEDGAWAVAVSSGSTVLTLHRRPPPPAPMLELCVPPPLDLARTLTAEARDDARDGTTLNLSLSGARGFAPELPVVQVEVAGLHVQPCARCEPGGGRVRPSCRPKRTTGWLTRLGQRLAIWRSSIDDLFVVRGGARIVPRTVTEAAQGDAGPGPGPRPARPVSLTSCHHCHRVLTPGGHGATAPGAGALRRAQVVASECAKEFFERVSRRSCPEALPPPRPTPTVIRCPDHHRHHTICRQALQSALSLTDAEMDAVPRVHACWDTRAALASVGISTVGCASPAVHICTTCLEDLQQLLDCVLRFKHRRHEERAMDCFLRTEVWPGVPEPKRRVLRHVLFKRPYKIRTAEALLTAPPTVLLEALDSARLLLLQASLGLQEDFKLTARSAGSSSPSRQQPLLHCEIKLFHAWMAKALPK